MRDITRITLRIGMVFILIGGCVHNVYHFGKLTDKHAAYRYHPRYNYEYPTVQEQSINVDEGYTEYEDSLSPSQKENYY